tara:strand:+ start:9013 stop:9843 length:831 start_codon:yes stop_codon:yes gene_type:complete
MVAVSCLPCSYSKAWSPSDDANLHAWYNQTGLGDTGDDQTTWQDQSGNNLNLAESGSVNPTISTALINGLKGVAFGPDSGMTRLAFMDIDGQDFLFAVVFQDTNVNDFENTIVVIDLDAPTSGYGLFQFNYSTFLRTVTIGQDSGTVSVNSGNGYDEFYGSSGVHGGGVVWTLHRKGNTVTSTVNGISLNSFTEELSSTGNDAVHLGSYSGASNESQTTVNYETVVMLGDSIPDSTRIAVEGYLAYKFAKHDRLKTLANTDNHKYKKAQPWGVGRS